jgi:hypothetical protein
VHHWFKGRSTGEEGNFREEMAMMINFNMKSLMSKSRDSSVGIALGYGLDDRGSRVRFPAGAGNSSLHHRVQTGSGAHPASYPMGTGGSFPGINGRGLKLTTHLHLVPRSKEEWSYTSTPPIRP